MVTLPILRFENSRISIFEVCICTGLVEPIQTFVSVKTCLNHHEQAMSIFLSS